MKTIVKIFAFTAISIACACNREHSEIDTVPKDVDYSPNTNAACAFFYGDYYGINLDNYILHLIDGNSIDGQLDGTGTMLVLDLNCLVSLDMAIADGVYDALVMNDGSGKSFTFVTGSDQGDYFVGSYVYQNRSSRLHDVYYMVTEGNVDISYDRGVYKVVADIRAGGQDMVFVYEGVIDFLDSREVEKPCVDVVCKNLSQGEMDYCAQVYGDVGGDYANWLVYLVDPQIDIMTFQGHGDMVQIELNTASSARTAITPGHYSVVREFTNESIKLYSVIPGYVDGEDLYGTWYFNDDEGYQFGATSGEVDITYIVDTGEYQFDFNFYDQDLDSSFKGTYRGPMTYVDASAPVAKSSRKSMCDLPFAWKGLPGKSTMMRRATSLNKPATVPGHVVWKKQGQDCR